MAYHSIISIATLLYLCFIRGCHSGAIELNEQNFNDQLEKREFAIVNFYADWCHFSQQLNPIFDRAADVIQQEYPTVVLGRVNCVLQSTIATKYRVTKFPTLKLYRNGKVMKKEYRGHRSVEAFQKFVKEQIREDIEEITDIEKMELDINKRHIVGYFESKGEGYDVFRKVANYYKNDCQFHVVFGEASAQFRHGGDTAAFRNSQSSENIYYTNGFKPDNNIFSHWTQDKCVPLVREITFQNAEGLTEEGLPFLILFYDPNQDTKIIETYRSIVAEELYSERANINFLTGNGHQFSHPLLHLGKTTSDLPLITIDDFRHMYLFKEFNKLSEPGRLKQFVIDLNSGKLHREFHNGPDQPKAPADTQQPETVKSTDESNTATDKPDTPSTPPKSMFVKLAPNEQRYTLLHKDEL